MARRMKGEARHTITFEVHGADAAELEDRARAQLAEYLGFDPVTESQPHLLVNLHFDVRGHVESHEGVVLWQADVTASTYPQPEF